MKTFEVIIHYAKPSHCGGIQSATQRVVTHATNEEDAERSATIQGVNDPNYLYTQMVETNCIQGQ